MEVRFSDVSDRPIFPHWKKTTLKVPINKSPDFDKIQIKNLILPDGFTADYEKTLTNLPCTIDVTYDPFDNGYQRVNPSNCAIQVEADFSKKDTEVYKHVMGLKFNLPIAVAPDNDECLTLRCEICSRFFSDIAGPLKPRTLTTCGHSFCTECLQGVAAGQQTLKRIGIPCSKCRKITNRKPEDLPLNWPLINVIQEKNAEKEKDDSRKAERVEDPIVPCYEDSKHEGTLYCAKCDEVYCKRCFMNAHIPRAMSSHSSIPVKERPPVIPMCPEHPNRVAVFVCQLDTCTQHNIGCVGCRKNHKNHGAKIIEEVIDSNQEELNVSFETITKTCKSLDRDIRTAGLVIKSFDPESEQVANCKSEINKHFETARQVALKKLDNFVQEQGDRTRKLSELMTTQRTLARDVHREIERTLKRKNELYDVRDIVSEAHELEKLAKTWRGQFYQLKEYDFKPTMSSQPKKPCF